MSGVTLKELIILIVEVVEKFLHTQKLKVCYYSFQQENMERVKHLAHQVNGSAKPVTAQSKDRSPPCDILLLDTLPAGCLATVALGLSNDFIGAYMQEMLRKGKQIYVLQDAAGHYRESSKAYHTMMDTYRSLLTEYGFVFLADGERGEEQEQRTPAIAHSAAYTGNVLSRKDVLQFGEGSQVLLGSGVVVTSLAADTARQRNIQLTRMKKEAE